MSTNVPFFFENKKFHDSFLEDLDDSDEIYEILSLLNRIKTNNSDEIYNIINKNKIKNNRQVKKINNENNQPAQIGIKKISMRGRILKTSCIENNKNNRKNEDFYLINQNIRNRNFFNRNVPERISRPFNYEYNYIEVI